MRSIPLSSQITFPVGLDALWQSPAELPIPEPSLRSWLLDSGSLTERLQSFCDNFYVQLLGQQPLTLQAPEAQGLSIAGMDIDWQVREVLLYGDDVPWVFARSLIPQALCCGELQALGNKPLGKVIFNDPKFSRKPFEICQLPVPSGLLNILKVQATTQLWGRRSLFCHQQHEMMVAEIFLPHSPAYNMLDLIGEK